MNRVRKRILLIARNLPPLQGGIERLLEQALRLLESEFECHIIGPRGCSGRISASSVAEVPAGVPAFHFAALPKIAAAISQRRPDLCLAGNGLVAPLAEMAARLAGVPHGVFVYGLDIVVRSAVYGALFLPSIRRASAVFSISQSTTSAAIKYGIPKQAIHLLRPGVAQNSLVEIPDTSAFRERHGLRDRPVILSVGRLVPRKGLVEFVRSALPRILSEVPQACFVVVGSEPREAGKSAAGYADRITQAARQAGISDAVRLLGVLSDKDLACAYAAASVLAFPVLEIPHDMEGFGLVVLEAAVHGVPTAAFATGGVPDAMSADNGLLVSPGDYVAMSDAVLRLLTHNTVSITPESCRAHARRYSWDRYGEQLRSVCHSLTGQGADFR
jgi:phosphatidylinositol alpha-1,6-mannosyltransferase